jgi:replication initiation protein RepC
MNMTERFATSAFGPRRITRALFLQQERIRLARDVPQAGNHNTRAAVDKWQVLRALTEAHRHFGLTDRTLTVLDALCSFHPERELEATSETVVFPSNAELSIRSRGMAAATLRRHLAALVQAGFIIRRDSANGKRYARRGVSGAIVDAFGFDLSPLAVRAAEIHAAADHALAEARDYTRLRAEITIHLRDVAKTVEAGERELRQPAVWQAFRERLAALSGRISRSADHEPLRTRLSVLIRLRAEVEKTWLDSIPEAVLQSQEVEHMSGNAPQNERRIHNSNTNYQFDNSNENAKKQNGRQKSPTTTDGLQSEGLNREPLHVPGLGRVLDACPAIKDYAAHGIGTWRDLVVTAGLVRAMLGISPHAWDQACRAMGDFAAALTVAAILERADKIKSPGGYLRKLTARAELGRFTVEPMLKALET